MLKINKVGIYSGTFDPVHTGHIEFALAAIENANLKKLFILPEHSPRAKKIVTDYNLRLKMLKLATIGLKRIKVLDIPEKQFFVHSTLPLLQSMNPRDSLVYICGSDVVKTFTYRWEGLRELLLTTEIIVGLRSGDSKTEIESILKDLSVKEDVVINFSIINSPKHHLSSTTIRNGSETIKQLNPKVADFITKNKLYS